MTYISLRDCAEAIWNRGILYDRFALLKLEKVLLMKPGQRLIRSFVRRRGRMTLAQQQALANYWSTYGIDYQAGQLIDFEQIYQRCAPVVLEIGFGTGAALLAMAQLQPENNYLGIDVHEPGVGHLLSQLQMGALDHVRVCRHDACEVLRHAIADESLSRVHIFFPDPWPKKKHHKRRLIQAEFVALLRTKLKINGVLHMATDWQPYAEHMMSVLSASEGFENVQAPGAYLTEKPAYRIRTRFEQRGMNLGHGVWDLMFKRVS